MEDKDIQKNIAELAPTLDEINRLQKQDVPDGYFDQLNQKILAQTTDIQYIKPKKIAFYRYLRIASILIFLVGLCLWVFQYSSTQKETIPIANNDILEYIDAHISDYNETEFEEQLDPSELSLAADFSDEEILDELNGDDFSIDLLEEQF